MTEPSAVSQILGFLAFCGLVAVLLAGWTFALRQPRNAAPTPDARSGSGRATTCGCGAPAVRIITTPDALWGVCATHDPARKKAQA